MTIFHHNPDSGPGTPIFTTTTVHVRPCLDVTTAHPPTRPVHTQSNNM